MRSVTVEDLKTVIALQDLPDAHLQWLIDHSEYHEYEEGTLLTRTGDPANYMWILLEGKLDYYMDVNGTLVYYLTFENDRLTGGISGLIPHSRMKVFLGSWYGVGTVRALLLHKDRFAELEQLNPEFIQRLIGYMTERAKVFATIQLQHEKVSALGKLSAGIAHELNNPAAAIGRISSELLVRLNLNYELTENLLRNNISSEHIHRVRSVVLDKEHEPAGGRKLTPLQRIEHEDDLSDWLESNKIAEHRQAAETFSEFGFSKDDLEQIRDRSHSDAFSDVLRWLENLLVSRRIVKDLEEASGRISNLVGAIKSHVHMDRTNDIQRTNLHTDIENTLTLLGHKLREKNITVTRQFCDDMVQVEAYIGELNQVWTNLIDNAIDALAKDGELTISTQCDAKTVTVRVIDNGSGIAKDIISRIFDPFFTTKPMGQGTGIGLDIVSRIVKRHNGEIKVNSAPGRTEFIVCIPISQNAKAV